MYSFHYDRRSSSIRNDAGDRIAELSGVSDEYPGCGEMFAAAPELLKALQSAAAYLSYASAKTHLPEQFDGQCDKVWLEATAWIAKAGASDRSRANPPCHVSPRQAQKSGQDQSGTQEC